jgi:redox-sensitive bicupin YhaK (pirin superfamily)
LVLLGSRYSASPRRPGSSGCLPPPRCRRFRPRRCRSRWLSSACSCLGSAGYHRDLNAACSPRNHGRRPAGYSGAHGQRHPPLHRHHSPQRRAPGAGPGHQRRRRRQAHRVLTQDLQRRLDPFLMLDAFGTDNPGDYIGGFPDHPHRGFETVTYMLQAACATATAPATKACWARRRAVDDRRPRRHPQRDARAGGRPHGRLPALAEPAGARQDVRALVPRHPRAPRSPNGRAGATVRVIAGHSHGVQARCSARPPSRCTWTCTWKPAPPSSSRCRPPQRLRLRLPRRAGHRRHRRAPPAHGHPGQHPGSDGVVLQAGAEGARAILVAGRPLNEPIAQYGPFVMNTHQEILPGGGGLQGRPPGLTPRAGCPPAAACRCPPPANPHWTPARCHPPRRPRRRHRPPPQPGEPAPAAPPLR